PSRDEDAPRRGTVRGEIRVGNREKAEAPRFEHSPFFVYVARPRTPQRETSDGIEETGARHDPPLLLQASWALVVRCEEGVERGTVSDLSVVAAGRSGACDDSMLAELLESLDQRAHRRREARCDGDPDFLGGGMPGGQCENEGHVSRAQSSANHRYVLLPPRSIRAGVWAHERRIRLIKSREAPCSARPRGRRSS